MTNAAVAVSAPKARTIARKTRSGALSPGFAGPGHFAAEIFGPADLAKSDPFVMLMDDRLDFKPGQPVGEPHPHAGLETVTLVLEGSLDDPAEGRLEQGDLAWMSAGRGVVHNEDVRATGPARILQLWVALPLAFRDADPDLQVVARDDAPVRHAAGVEARLYSGETGALSSPTRNRVPATVVDFQLQANASVDQALPGAYRAFVYVDQGSLVIGETELTQGDVGWIDPVGAPDTELVFHAGPQGARVLLYAGRPAGEPIVHRGPFVAGSEAELTAFYKTYRSGVFRRISEVVAGR